MPIRLIHCWIYPRPRHPSPRDELPSYRLRVDVGGTFTDFLLLREDTGVTWRAKLPSTPEDQSICVLSGKNQILSQIPDGADIVLCIIKPGVTVATNIILGQKGPRVAFVLTEGYKDILQTRRSQVPGGLASWIIWPKPEPLAPLELTIEAPGKLAAGGTTVHAFSEKLCEKSSSHSVDRKPDAMTVSLINSFANPGHERKGSTYRG